MSASDFRVVRGPNGDWTVVVAGGSISIPRKTRLEARRDLRELHASPLARALALARLAREPLTFAFVDLHVLARELHTAVRECDRRFYPVVALELIDDTGLSDLASFTLAFVRNEVLRGGDIPELPDEMLRIANNLHRG